MIFSEYDQGMAVDEPGRGASAPTVERPPGGSIVFLLSKLGFVASRGFHDALATVGLDPRQFGVLNLVASSEGLSQRALTDPLGIPASRVVAIVDELEEGGLVERRRNPDDRRAHALYLTAKGRKTLDRARGIAVENDAWFGASLTTDEREQLVALLAKLAADRGGAPGMHPGLVSPD
jgi:DNA-binding MarR family transcriptional regulator